MERNSPSPGFRFERAEAAQDIGFLAIVFLVLILRVCERASDLENEETKSTAATYLFESKGDLPIRLRILFQLKSTSLRKSTLK